jgi:hypothetical protein
MENNICRFPAAYVVRASHGRSAARADDASRLARPATTARAKRAFALISRFKQFRLAVRYWRTLNYTWRAAWSAAGR